MKSWAFYNEFEPQIAQWLRNLMRRGLIPDGYVDERSITDVEPDDLKEFTQCHFFAGIGGWPLALRMAGWPDERPVWSGSPPCQPFSAAGKQLGQLDPRHLAPVFTHLISECRPPVLFGEQVAPAIAKSWMCDLQAHLEGEDYAVGFAVLPACSVGAPHKRDRLFFGAYNLAYPRNLGCEQQQDEQRAGIQFKNAVSTECRNGFSVNSAGLCSVADADSERLQRERRDSDSQGRKGPYFRQAGLPDGAGTENKTTNSHHSFWSGADWLGCRDGKFRPVRPGSQPLAHGVPGRVVRLRAYGNAIVPPLAAQFILSFEEALIDLHRSRRADIDELI